MPRKQDPRWGEDGYSDMAGEFVSPPDFELSDEQIEELAEILGLEHSSPTMGWLRYEIDDIGQSYQRWKGRGAGAFTRGEARQALVELLSRDHIDASDVLALNGRASEVLYNALMVVDCSSQSSNGGLAAALFEGLLPDSDLRRAAWYAVDDLAERKGRDPDVEVGWAVAELCRAYEAATSRRATLSNKDEGLGYDENPRSSCGRFVLCCMKMIDAHIRPSLISRGIRQFIKRRDLPRQAAGTYSSEQFPEKAR